LLIVIPQQRETPLDMTKGEYVRGRMTKPIDVGHLRAHLGSFAFLIHNHEKPVKLTMKDAQDTKKFTVAASL